MNHQNEPAASRPKLPKALNPLLRWLEGKAPTRDYPTNWMEREIALQEAAERDLAFCRAPKKTAALQQ